MSTDRRILSWLAILASAFAFVPCACFFSFLALVSGGMALDPEYYWEASDTFLFTGFTVFALITTAAALFLIIWGARALSNKNPSLNN